METLLDAKVRELSDPLVHNNLPVLHLHAYGNSR